MTRTPKTVLSVDENRMFQAFFWQRKSVGSSPVIYKYTGCPELSGNIQGKFFYLKICRPLFPTHSELKKSVSHASQWLPHDNF